MKTPRISIFNLTFLFEIEGSDLVIFTILLFDFMLFFWG